MEIGDAKEVYFLDTNAYALLLRGIPAQADARLRAKLSCGDYIEAAISLLTALEIHSVVGQLARAQSGGLHSCERTVLATEGHTHCAHRWIQTQRAGLRPREVDRLRKSIKDAESGRGPIRLTVVPIIPLDFENGRMRLYSHAVKWRFGSHDAVISAAAANFAGGNARFVTSDTALKSCLKAVGQRYYDPLKDELWR